MLGCHLSVRGSNRDMSRFFSLLLLHLRSIANSAVMNTLTVGLHCHAVTVTEKIRRWELHGESHAPDLIMRRLRNWNRQHNHHALAPPGRNIIIITFIWLLTNVFCVLCVRAFVCVGVCVGGCACRAYVGVWSQITGHICTESDNSRSYIGSFLSNLMRLSIDQQFKICLASKSCECLD